MSHRDTTRVGAPSGVAPAPGIGPVPREGNANERQNYRSPQGNDPIYPAHFPDQSAKHADGALTALAQARATSDSREREQEIAVGQVLATLSLRDKVDELCQTLKDVLGHAVETDAIRKVA